jgi:hypothetical protein
MASDRRPYTKILDAVLREPWDDATLADMVRLQLWLNTRWARLRLTADEAGRAFLGPQDMMTITKTTNVTRARARLLALRERTGGVTVAVAEASQGRTCGVSVDWPKFPIVQGYQDRLSPKFGAISGPARASASATAYKRGAHAPVKSLSTYRTTPDTSEPETEHDRSFAATLASLKAEDDRDYSVAEIEERMTQEKATA